MFRLSGFMTVIFGLSVAVSGCGPNATQTLLTNGIGTHMDVPEAKKRVELLEVYYGLMCGRATVSVHRTSDNNLACDFDNISVRDWPNIVRASMNDTDERCDRYIETLHSATRDKEYKETQLTAIENTTDTILGLDAKAIKRISKKSISVISKLFGFAEGSLQNYYSRLILEFPQGTIRSLVKKRQAAYRTKLERGYMKDVVDRTSSYYAMRGYLRLCTPTSIEREIKATVDSLNYAANGKRQQIGNDEDPDLESLASLPK